MSYQEEIQRRESATVAAQREASNREAFNLICDHWPLSDTTANFKMLVEWCNGDITVGRFQTLIETNPEGFHLDWAATRDRLLAEIANELDPSGKRVTESDLNQLYQRRARGENVVIDQTIVVKSRNIETELKKLMFSTKAQLRAKLAELRYRRLVKEKSAGELHEDLAAHRASQQNPYHPYEKMPDSITAAEIKAASVHKLKFFNAKYGPQVNARLNGNR